MDTTPDKTWTSGVVSSHLPLRIIYTLFFLNEIAIQRTRGVRAYSNRSIQKAEVDTVKNGKTDTCGQMSRLHR